MHGAEKVKVALAKRLWSGGYMESLHLLNYEPHYEAHAHSEKLIAAMSFSL